MWKIPEFILIIIDILSVLLFILIYYKIYKNFNYVENYHEFFIILESKEKKFIEYYPKILFSSKNEQIPKKQFKLNKYDFFCYCRNNTNYRIYDKNLCLTSKECNPNFQTSKESCELINLEIWNEKNINNNKQKYVFFQGIKNSTGECDTIFKYKKCGFLIDLNTSFCIKENELCPFDNNNTTFFLSNLSSDIIMLYEGKNIQIYNNIEINDLFLDIYNKNNKSINYEIIDYSNIYKIIYDNNIPYFKEIIKENLKNITIELGLLKIKNSDIKLDQNLLKEKAKIYQTNPFYYFSLFFFVFIIIFTIINIIIFKHAQEEHINKTDEKSLEEYFGALIGKSIIGVILIAMEIYLYYDTKSKLDKEYIFNDEYYIYLQSIKRKIIYLLLLIPLSESNLIMIMIQRIKCDCFTKKEFKFIEIK